MSKRNNASRDHLRAVLNDRNKLINQTKGIGGILAQLLRTIFKEQNITDTVFNTVCDEYINSARFGLSSKVAQYLNRGNIRRQVSQDTLTWKVFVRALKIMQVSRFVISIELHYHSGKPASFHEVGVDTGSPGIKADESDFSKGA